MAYSAWIKSVNPSTGSGNGTVKVTGNENSGRSARQTTLTITAAGVEDHEVVVMQAGKPEYVNQATTATAAKGGQTVTIEGLSNSKNLTFSLGSGDLEVALPTAYTANGVAATNGEDIVGDPGNSKEYAFSVQFVVAVNDTISEHSKQIIVTDEAGHTSICTLTQAAGDPTLTVSVEQIEMNYLGEEVSFNVVSNTNWSIA